MHKQGKVVATPSQTRNAKSTGRPFTIHSVVLDTGDTIEIGFEQPYKIGDIFSGMTETKYGKLKLTIPTDPNANVTQQPTSAATSGHAEAPAAGPGSCTAKDKAIIRQNALTAAANIYAATIKPGLTTSMPPAEDVLTYAEQLSEFALGAWE